MGKNQKINVQQLHSRSIYSKLLIRVLVCGYLLLLSILKCLNNIPEAAINNILIVVSIILVLLCIYFIIIPLENEDEMVLELYAKANSLSDTITQIGLMTIICLLNAQKYYSNFIVSSELLTAIVSGLLFLVAVIRVLSIFYNSKKGV